MCGLDDGWEMMVPSMENPKRNPSLYQDSGKYLTLHLSILNGGASPREEKENVNGGEEIKKV